VADASILLIGPPSKGFGMAGKAHEQFEQKLAAAIC
jgi:hypothetical protein